MVGKGRVDLGAMATEMVGKANRNVKGNRTMSRATTPGQSGPGSNGNGNGRKG